MLLNPLFPCCLSTHGRSVKPNLRAARVTSSRVNSLNYCPEWCIIPRLIYGHSYLFLHAFRILCMRRSDPVILLRGININVSLVLHYRVPRRSAPLRGYPTCSGPRKYRQLCAMCLLSLRRVVPAGEARYQESVIIQLSHGHADQQIRCWTRQRRYQAYHSFPQCPALVASDGLELDNPWAKLRGHCSIEGGNFGAQGRA